MNTTTSENLVITPSTVESTPATQAPSVPSPFIAKAIEIREQIDSNKTDSVWLSIRMGVYLVQAKYSVGHGAWMREVKMHCVASKRTAERYMALASNLFPEELKNDSVSFLGESELPEAAVATVKGKIAGKTLQALYVEHGISQKAVKPKLMSEKALLAQLRLLNAKIESVQGTDVDENSTEELKGKLTECEKAVQLAFEAINQQGSTSD